MVGRLSVFNDNIRHIERSTRPIRIECLTDDECFELAIRLMDGVIGDEDMRSSIREIENNPAHTDSLRRSIVSLLYRVGVVGLKLERFECVAWSTSGRRSVSISEIGRGVKVSIHPCFWRSLGINPETEPIEQLDGYWPPARPTIEI